MLDTSFFDDFIDIMDQYCYYRNRFKIFHLRLLYIKNLNSIFDTESTNIYSIDSKKIYNYKNRVLACFQTRPPEFAWTAQPKIPMFFNPKTNASHFKFLISYEACSWCEKDIIEGLLVEPYFQYINLN